MAKFRLNETHPDQQKLNQLIDLAEELKIQLNFDGPNCYVSIGDNSYQVEDIEPDHHVCGFPNQTETKLTYTKEDS